MAAPASAQAATEIGDSTSTPAGPGGGPNTYIQTGDPTGRTYAVPAGGGVITRWATQVGTSTGVSATVKLKVLRPVAGGKFLVVGSAPGTFTGTGSFARSSFSAQIPVQAGDRIGIYVPSGPSVGGAAGPGGSISTFSGEAVDGAEITPPAPSSGTALLISATVEPDADGDGFGDESQDACLGDAAHAVAPCGADLAPSLSFRPRGVSPGDVSLVTATIRSLAGGTAPNASVDLTVPGGVRVLSAVGAAGDCTRAGALLSCPLGDVPRGGERRAYVLVRSLRRGNFVFTAHSLYGIELNGANDVTTARLRSAPGLSKDGYCKVPKLRGSTRVRAKAKLTKAGCRLGRASGAKSKRAHVTSQAIPPGTQVRIGTKVGVTLSA